MLVEGGGKKGKEMGSLTRKDCTVFMDRVGGMGLLCTESSYPHDRGVGLQVPIWPPWFLSEAAQEEGEGGSLRRPDSVSNSH